QRRAGEEKFDFPLPELKRILEKTYGVPIFQEQVMAMAMIVADFSAGEADNLRRAMGTWKREGGEKLARIAAHLEEKLVSKGVKPEFAQQIVNQIKGFAEYGFPESHAASFAILAYVSAYLKHYYQDCFLAGLLNSLPMGFYSSHTLVYDAKRQGVEVRGVELPYSTWDNQVETPGVVRLGLREIRGLSKKTGLATEAVFKKNPDLDFHAFVKALRDTLFPRPLIKRELFLMAFAGAFKSFGMSRREAIWEIQALSVEEELFLPEPETSPNFPKESSWEKIRYDYESHGVSLYAHPMSYFRKYLMANLYMDSKTLQQTSKKYVRTSGVVICRQMPSTASGVLFITLEDEFGFVNLVLWKRVYEQFRDTILSHSFLLVEGKLDSPKNARVIHIIVDKVTPLLTPDDRMNQFPSHDFH
ncbi:MAG: OB-fold nucleic acid binding domain-containing protein, partial [Bdellovibrionota bacterium]